MTNLIDLTGQTFQRWTVLRRDSAVKRKGQARWLCRCACGAERTVRSCSLRTGETRSCGCLKSELTAKAFMQRYGDLTGQTFGTLTVRRYESGRWLCTCAEGHEVLRTRNSLKRDVPCDHCEAKRLDARTADIHDRYVVKRQSLKTIATAYDVDLKTAWLWVRRAGIKTRPRGAPRGPRPASHPKCDLAVERYRNGETSVAIGRDLGVDPSSVTRWAKRAGVEPHPMGRAPKRHPVAAELIDNVVAQLNTDPPAPTPRDLVLDLHAQGVARKTIAHDLGLSVKTVGRWIADADRERVTRIRAMAHAGVPHAAIAEAFGVSCAYVGLLAREGRERAA